MQILIGSNPLRFCNVNNQTICAYSSSSMTFSGQWVFDNVCTCIIIRARGVVLTIQCLFHGNISCKDICKNMKSYEFFFGKCYPVFRL